MAIYMSDSDEVNTGVPLGSSGRLFHNDPSRIAILAGASELLGQFSAISSQAQCCNSRSFDFPGITRPWVRQSYFEQIRVRFVDDLPDRDLTDATTTHRRNYPCHSC
jgi:hypothetical protein